MNQSYKDIEIILVDDGSKDKSGEDGKSMGVKLVTFMNQKARSAMPICDRYKVLLPIGWFYTGGRHLVRIVQGKRPKIHVNAMMAGARKRREIYKEFHLYES